MPRRPYKSKANEPTPPHRWPEILLALAAFLLVVAELDPTGTYDWLPDGPGLTIDESLNVQQGVRTEVGLRRWLEGRITLREYFGDLEMLGDRAPIGYHAADYPPWGRYLLGLSHAIVTTFAFPADWETLFVVAAARFASAVAFAVTVWLIATYATDTFGRPAGLAAGAALLVMPRVFGHAHLASLETIMGLFYTVTLVSIARRWRSDSPVTNGAAVVAGVWWGLAMLVKIQAILIPPVVTIWAFYHWRWRAFRPLAIMALVGMAVFFVGWPWLWFDPGGHLLAYFGQTTNRAVLPVWYMGQVWQDVNTPWHYPFVITMVTVPLGVLALAAWGLFGGGDRAHAGWRRPDVQLFMLGFVIPLVVFAIPGVAVYDGARLFLVAFPPLAIVAGRGGGLAWDWLRKRFSVWTTGVVAAVVVVVSATPALMTRPVYLSSYNWGVGGLAGAERLGFGVNYWADALTSDILNTAARELPKGSTLAVTPVLHQFQLDALLAQTSSLRARDIHLVEYGRPGAADADGLLIYERRASLPASLRSKLDGLRPSAVVERQGVRLAALYIPSPQPPTPNLYDQTDSLR